MISQMMIALIVDDTPEFVIKGEIERNKLFKLYKEREHKSEKHGIDHFEDMNGVDQHKARKNLQEILAGVPI